VVIPRTCTAFGARSHGQKHSGASPRPPTISADWRACLEPIHPSGLRADHSRPDAIYTLTETAKLCDIDPQAWLADVLTRLQDHPARRIAELLPWNWKPPQQQRAAA
jgi:hypothetical protein